MARIGFLGGTGTEAKGLALRFASAGATVLLGSRSPERASLAAEAHNSILGKPLLRGVSNQEMLGSSEVVFLTVPFEQAVAAVESCRLWFRPDHIVVDVTVPMVFYGGSAEYIEPGGESNAESIARHLPDGTFLVAAFKTIPAHVLADLDVLLDCDVFVCSDSEPASQAVMAAARLIPSLRPVDGGPLRTARTLERMAVLAVNLNRRYREKRARFRVQGI